ncbi:hypothetical protein HK097_009701 [Rhizophlyctis rosea]|uniref:Uncharacterized protein n=1 Tax=Rhizophlyctis rosea TaxID=64517 RepID=A0AAD5X4C0_9FUNG|nr:hypothetical protein HK097_009701 [Rhizophlyctis rosea]
MANTPPKTYAQAGQPNPSRQLYLGIRSRYNTVKSSDPGTRSPNTTQNLSKKWETQSRPIALSRLNTEINLLGELLSVKEDRPGTPSLELRSRIMAVEQQLELVEASDAMSDQMTELNSWKTRTETLNLYAEYLSVFIEKKIVQPLKDEECAGWLALSILLDKEVARVAYKYAEELDDVRLLKVRKDKLMEQPYHAKIKLLYEKLGMSDEGC